MKKHLICILALLACLCSCKKEELTTFDVVGGNLNKRVINNLRGFDDDLPTLLNECKISYSEFLLMTVDSCWNFPESTRTKVRQLREAVSKPDKYTMMTKILTMDEVADYLNNVDGGRISGPVFYAGDLKNVYTMHDIYWGLRLDYEDSPFNEKAAGYAVIRFYVSSPDCISIPYCKEMGGTLPHCWPYGGGGFTCSTLGNGGYPIWNIEYATEPVEGAEIYEVNRNGYEILRAVYSREKKWLAADKGYSPTSK